MLIQRFFVGTRFIASEAQFIERDHDKLCLQATSNTISRDKLRNGRDKSGPYENASSRLID